MSEELRFLEDLSRHVQEDAGLEEIATLLEKYNALRNGALFFDLCQRIVEEGDDAVLLQQLQKLCVQVRDTGTLLTGRSTTSGDVMLRFVLQFAPLLLLLSLHRGVAGQARVTSQTTLRALAGAAAVAQEAQLADVEARAHDIDELRAEVTSGASVRTKRLLATDELFPVVQDPKAPLRSSSFHVRPARDNLVPPSALEEAAEQLRSPATRHADERDRMVSSWTRLRLSKHLHNSEAELRLCAGVTLRLCTLFARALPPHAATLLAVSIGALAAGSSRRPLLKEPDEEHPVGDRGHFAPCFLSITDVTLEFDTGDSGTPSSSTSSQMPRVLGSGPAWVHMSSQERRCVVLLHEMHQGKEGRVATGEYLLADEFLLHCMPRALMQTLARKESREVSLHALAALHERALADSHAALQLETQALMDYLASDDARELLSL
ncbi:MAG: hypothetical protein MHM6MM_000736 [Cercozoa sp. M6MM]